MATRKELRMAILKEVEAGTLSIEDGSQRIASLESEELSPPESINQSFVSENEPPANSATPAASDEIDEEQAAESIPPQSSGSASPSVKPEVLEHYDEKTAEKRLQELRRWWILPFSIGLFLTILGAYWMYLGWMTAGASWGFWLSWIPFGLGILLTVLSWYSQEAPWLYLRVHQKPGDKPQKIVIIMPLPLGLAAWVFRNFDHYMPVELRDKHLGDVLDELGKSFSPDAPLEVYVDDDDGDKVEIIIAGGKRRPVAPA